MSVIWQCLSCKGKYADTMPDGSLYAHVCPSVIRNQDGTLIDNQNPRNENRTSNRLGLETEIVAEGAGVKSMSDPNLEEPQWISEMKARIATREDTGND